MVGKSKTRTFNGLKEQVLKRICGWKEKLLSKAGKEVLIKAVAQSIPTYTMSCFKLPKTWCTDLQSTISNFWWGQRNSEHKIHWTKWSKVCQQKSHGGLGFKDLQAFNLTLLAKQGWRLLQNTTSLFYRLLMQGIFLICPAYMPN